MDVEVVTNTDLSNIAAQHSIHPDTSVLTKLDISDDLGGRIDVGSVSDNWGNSLIRAHHAAFSSSRAPLTNPSGIPNGLYINALCANLDAIPKLGRKIGKCVVAHKEQETADDIRRLPASPRLQFPASFRISV